ncbi:MAG: YIP1 family protein [Acidobacteriota bacterium]
MEELQTETASEMSAAGRLMGIFIEPGRTFHSIAASPGWILPLLVTIVFVLISSNLVINRMGGMEVIIKKQMESNPKSLERMQQQGMDVDEIARQQGTGVIGALYSYVIPPVFVIVSVLALAGIFLLFLSMLGGQPTFRKTLSMVMHVSFAYYLLHGLLTILVVFLHSTPQDIDIRNPVYSNPSSLVENTQPALKALLGSIDAFSLWQIWLLGLGLSIVTPNVSRGKAYALVIGLWAVYVVGKVAMSAIF